MSAPQPTAVSERKVRIRPANVEPYLKYLQAKEEWNSNHKTNVPNNDCRRTIPALNPLKVPMRREEETKITPKVVNQNSDQQLFKTPANNSESTDSTINPGESFTITDHSQKPQELKEAHFKIPFCPKLKQISSPMSRASSPKPNTQVNSLRNVRKVPDRRDGTPQKHVVVPVAPTARRYSKTQSTQTHFVRILDDDDDDLPSPPPPKVSRGMQTNHIVTNDEYDILHYQRVDYVNDQQCMPSFEETGLDSNNNNNQFNNENRQRESFITEDCDPPADPETEPPDTGSDEEVHQIDGTTVDKIVAYSNYNKKMLQIPVSESTDMIIKNFQNKLNDKAKVCDKKNGSGKQSNDCIEASPKPKSIPANVKVRASVNDNKTQVSPRPLPKSLHKYQHITSPNDVATRKNPQEHYSGRLTISENDTANETYLARRHTKPVQVPTPPQRPPISITPVPDQPACSTAEQDQYYGRYDTNYRMSYNRMAPVGYASLQERQHQVPQTPQNEQSSTPQNAQYGMPHGAQYAMTHMAQFRMPHNAQYGMPHNTHYGMSHNANFGIPQNAQYDMPHNVQYGMPHNVQYGMRQMRRENCQYSANANSDQVVHSWHYDRYNMHRGRGWP